MQLQPRAVSGPRRPDCALAPDCLVPPAAFAHANATENCSGPGRERQRGFRQSENFVALNWVGRWTGSKRPATMRWRTAWQRRSVGHRSVGSLTYLPLLAMIVRLRGGGEITRGQCRRDISEVQQPLGLISRLETKCGRALSNID